MKAFTAVYRYGRLYDSQTNHRIYLAEDAHVTLVVADEKQLIGYDPHNQCDQILSFEEQLGAVKKKKYTAYKLIAARGHQLEFTIRAGRTSQKGKYKVVCTFNVSLLEDLYMTQKRPKDEYGVVHPCKCQVTSVSGTALPGFEPLYAYSLNDAYMKTYDFYFALYGKPTTNVYYDFFVITPEKKVLLHNYRMWPINKPQITSQL